MKVIAILVDAMPKSPDKCPFHSGDWENWCSIGGKCSLYYSGRCHKLTAPFDPETIDANPYGEDGYERYER